MAMMSAKEYQVGRIGRKSIYRVKLVDRAGSQNGSATFGFCHRVDGKVLRRTRVSKNRRLATTACIPAQFTSGM